MLCSHGIFQKFNKWVSGANAWFLFQKIKQQKNVNPEKKV